MSINNTDLHRDIGRMEAGLEALKEIVTEGFKGNSDRLDKVEQRLAALETRESERKGAWKTLVALCGAVGGFVAFAVQYLFGK